MKNQTNPGKEDPSYNEILDILLSLDGKCIRYLSNPTDEQIEIALDSSPEAILNIPEEKRTKERWMKAARVDYFSLFKAHPIYELKNSTLPKEDIKDLYIAFIERNCTVLGGDLITDFKSVLSTDETVDIWKAIAKNVEEAQFAFLQCDCPEKLYRYAVDLDVKNILCFDISMWKLGDIINALTVKPDIMHKVFNSFDVCNEGRKFIDIVRLAIDRCEYSIYIKHILMEYYNYAACMDFNSFQILMGSHNWNKILQSALIYCNFDRDKALYVFQNFEFDTLIDNVDRYTLKYIAHYLPLFKRIKYLIKIKHMKGSNKHE